MININFIGLIGGFIIGPLARRYRKQLEVTKVTLPLSAMAATLLSVALRFDNFYVPIVLSLMCFGFFGLGSFPLILELAVEVGRVIIGKHSN